MHVTKHIMLPMYTISLITPVTSDTTLSQQPPERVCMTLLPVGHCTQPGHASKAAF